MLFPMIGVLWVTSMQYMHIFLQLQARTHNFPVKLPTYVTLRLLRLCLVMFETIFFEDSCAEFHWLPEKVPVFPSARYFLIGSATSPRNNLERSSAAKSTSQRAEERLG